MSDGRFKKGHKTWNKNMKGIHLSPTSEFKKGQFSLEEHPSWTGGVHVMKNDCTHLQVESCKRVRRPRYIYEQAHGPLAKGMCIYHLDGNKYNDDESNLIAVTRAELLKLNLSHLKD